MTEAGAMTAQFRLIILDKCCGQQGSRKPCPDADWPDVDVPCVFHMMTTILGYVLMLTVSLVRIPIIFKILRSQSGKSYVSPLDIILNVVTTSSFVAYAVNCNFPISTWGEGIIGLAQYVTIINLMFVYHGRHRNAIAFMLLYIPVMVALLWPLVPCHLIVAFNVVNLPIHTMRRITDIYTSHKQKNDLTRRSLVLYNFTSIGRLLTSVVDTKDALMVMLYLQDCAFNGVLTLQVLRHKSKKRKLEALDSKVNEAIKR